MEEKMMMEMLEAIRKAGDAVYSVHHDTYWVTVLDFDGFDENWSEVMRDYADEEQVEEFEDWLEEHASSVEDGYYHFEGFSVHLGYACDDI